MFTGNLTLMLIFGEILDPLWLQQGKILLVVIHVDNG